MIENRQIRSRLCTFADQWLASPVGRTSIERDDVASARAKLSNGSDDFTDDEKEAVISCMMETVDISSPFADEVIRFFEDLDARKSP